MIGETKNKTDKNISKSHKSLIELKTLDIILDNILESFVISEKILPCSIL